MKKLKLIALVVSLMSCLTAVHAEDTGVVTKESGVILADSHIRNYLGTIDSDVCNYPAVTVCF